MASATTPCTAQSCWKRRTHLEKRLVVLLVFLFVTGVVVAVIIAVHRAARLLEAMNQTADPCDDFFEFACGTWNRHNVIPSDRSYFNTFRKLGDELQATLKVLMETPVEDSESASVKKVKNLYQSCVNISAIDERQAKPLLTLLEELGGWPILESNTANWTVDKFDLETILAELRLYNNRILVNAWVGPDDKNSQVNIITLDQGVLGLPSREYFLKSRDDHVLMTYQKFAIDVALALGASSDRATAEVTEMIDFEIQLANITVPEEQRRDTEAMYSKMTVEQVNENLTQNFNWLKYLRKIFDKVNVHIPADEEVVVYASSYLEKLDQLITSTPKRTLANYVLWQFVGNRLGNLPQKFTDIRRALNKVLYGIDQEQARWRTCVGYVNDYLGMAVGRIFVEQHFNEESKASALKMIQSIQEAFTELLEEVSWMDQETRKVAKEKADAIQEKIGYPDYIMNNTALDLDYDGLEIDAAKYFENVLQNLKFGSKKNLEVLRKPVNRSKWGTTPAVVNAFYSASKNQIMFPAGILQPPFYHSSYPRYLQFSGIAIAVGHEITHGFDDEDFALETDFFYFARNGRQYDKDGNLKQWWPDHVIENFKEKARCIIDQYSNYTVVEVGLNLNGRLTQGENIADNGGLKQAFRAYKNWVKTSGAEELALPGLNLTNEQLFFLNFAQIWCGTARPESYVQTLRVNRHSPGRYRVIGAVSNSPDFASAYNCPAGSPMNPSEKCSVW